MRNEVHYEEGGDVVLVAFHTAAAQAPLKSQSIYHPAQPAWTWTAILWLAHSLMSPEVQFSEKDAEICPAVIGIAIMSLGAFVCRKPGELVAIRVEQNLNLPDKSGAK